MIFTQNFKSEKKDRTPKSFSNFGFSTIFLTFSMICIVTFSALALITANSDYQLSKKVADKTTTYYKSIQKANKTLSDIDQMLSETYKDTDSMEDYNKEVALELTRRTDGEFSYSENGELEFNYSEEISDTQALYVTLIINYPTSQGDTFYTVSRWQTITDTNVEDERLNLIATNN